MPENNACMDAKREFRVRAYVLTNENRAMLWYSMVLMVMNVMNDDRGVIIFEHHTHTHINKRSK